MGNLEPFLFGFEVWHLILHLQDGGMLQRSRAPHPGQRAFPKHQCVQWNTTRCQKTAEC